MAAAECVKNYKRLREVERAFRSIRTISLQVRPVHHRTDEQIEAHNILCMLAFYVEWHMREAWRELLDSDSLLDELRQTRVAVLPPPRSAVAKRKVSTGRLEDDSLVYCFRTLIEYLESITVNLCRAKVVVEDSVPFELTSLANDKQ